MQFNRHLHLHSEGGHSFEPNKGGGLGIGKFVWVKGPVATEGLGTKGATRNHLEERLLGQAYARTPYAPPPPRVKCHASVKKKNKENIDFFECHVSDLR